MTDFIDQATAIIEFQNTVDISNSHRAEPTDKANGECWFCGEYLPAGHRWCDASCRDDWQREQNNQV